jgi:hypothetical protein
MARYPFNDLVVICTAIWSVFWRFTCAFNVRYSLVSKSTPGESHLQRISVSLSWPLMSNYNLCIFSPSTDKISVNSEKRKPNELPMGHINKESVRKECQKPLSSQLIPLFIFSELYRQTCRSLTYKVFNQNSVTSQ